MVLLNMHSQFLVLSLFVGLGALVGCEDTGFGQPCDFPKAPKIQQACKGTSATGEEGGTNVVTQSKPSCAVTEFAACETNICLIYRGSSAFCSVACEADSDCDGKAACRPLLGDKELDPSACQGDDAFSECYCVREGDL